MGPMSEKIWCAGRRNSWVPGKLRTGGDRYLEKAFGSLTYPAGKIWKKKLSTDSPASEGTQVDLVHSELCSGRKLER
jgi:hypothetical protein